MKTETITAPPARLSPEMRYASLHRTIENGMDTDRTWLELVQICVELHRRDEARTAFDHVHEPSLRRRAFNVLAAAGVRVDSPVNEGTDIEHSKLTPQGLIDWIADGFRYLFLDHMPLTTVVATVTFPLVVGLGGFLTSGVHNSWLLPLVALLPALSVVGLIGALGRRILVDASQGLDDMPEIPAAVPLMREAGRFLVDAALLAVICLGPGLAMTQLEGVGGSAIAAAFAVGGTLLPMALAMRQTRDDWSCLSPMNLFANIRLAGLRYFVAVAVSFVLLAPATLSVWLTWGSALYLVLSVVGPLLVVPIFVMSRLFGQSIIDLERQRFVEEREFAAASRVVHSAPPVVAQPAPAVATARASLRAPVHPEAAQREERQRPAMPAAAQPQRQPQAQPQPQAQQQPQQRQVARRAPAAAASTAPAPAARQVAARRPATTDPSTMPGGSLGLRSDRAVTPTGISRSTTPAEPNPAPTAIRASGETRTASVPAPRLRPRAETNSPPPAAAAQPTRFRGPVSSVVGEAIPDLTKLPGVSVLRGSARVAAGAAAPTRPPS